MLSNVAYDVAHADTGVRLDSFVLGRCPSTTRRLVIDAVASRNILLNGTPAGKGTLLAAGDRVLIVSLMEASDWKASPNPDVRIEILYQDDAILALNKPAGLPVHPLSPEESETLVSGLLAAHPELAGVGPDPLFPSIVHRLDAETSGVMLAARTLSAYETLRREFADRSAEKHYLAIVAGEAAAPGYLDQTLAHSDHGAHRMVVVDAARNRGRHPMRAITEYFPLQRQQGLTLLAVRIRTGVTHQIRCQLAAAGYPILGDRLYGPAVQPPAPGHPRLMLHAARIVIPHPVTGKSLDITAPFPLEFTAAGFAEV